LVTDPFGNYVVQYALDLGMDRVSQKIMQAFVGCFGSLSMNKFSSNVMEKCLSISRDQLRDTFIMELVEGERLPLLLQDQFANYVLQTALTISTPTQFQRMHDAIRPHLHLVRNTPYGKKIESKLNRGTTTSRPHHNSSSAKQQGGGYMGAHHPTACGGGINPNVMQNTNLLQNSNSSARHAAPHGSYPNINNMANAANANMVNMNMGSAMTANQFCGMSNDVWGPPPGSAYSNGPAMYWG
jgi:hypothetical protein